MDKDLAFIVSGGRTGTTFFGEYISEFIPDAFSVHEPDVVTQRSRRVLFKRIQDFGIWHMLIGRALGMTGIRPLSRRNLSGEFKDEAPLLGAIRQHRDSYFSRIDAPLVVESYSQWFGILPQLRKVYPEARIVGIIRDPREWVVSWLNHGGRHGPGDFVTMFGHKRLTPEMVGDMQWAEAWETMSPFEKLCWDWKIINGSIAEFCEADPGARLYRFEDLFLNEDDTPMRELIDFVADQPSGQYETKFRTDLLGKKVNSRGDKIAKWHAWTPEQARHLQAHCKPLMDRFGYGIETDWAEKLAA
ncbi:MAG: sulfotransferase [Hyphomonadaceae bacterium]|nr:sulfotransferase [Hyphomonadaceae bacterium]